jgi:hypothetical protein
LKARETAKKGCFNVRDSALRAQDGTATVIDGEGIYGSASG